MMRRSTAASYLVDRSLGLQSDFPSRVRSREARQLQASTSNFIYAPQIRISDIALDPTFDQFLLTSSTQSHIRLYDLQSLDATTMESFDATNQLPPVAQDVVYTPEASDRKRYGISSIDWYPIDNGIFITASLDGYLSIFDTETFEPVDQLKLPGTINCASFPVVTHESTTSSSISGSPHTLIAAGTSKNEIRLCDLDNSSTSHTLLGHREEVKTLAWSPSNNFQLVSGSKDGEIRMWDIRRSGSTACLLCFNAEGEAKPPGRTQLPFTTSISADRPKRTRPLKRQKTDGSGINLNLTKRPHWMTETPSSARKDQVLEDMRSRNSGRDPHLSASASSVVAHHGAINCVTYTPDGRYVLSNGKDKKLRLWNSSTGAHEFVNYKNLTSKNSDRVKRMAVVQEGSMMYGREDGPIVFCPSGDKGQLLCYDILGDGGVVSDYTGHYDMITACVYRKSRRELFSAGLDGLILAWRPVPMTFDPQVDKKEVQVDPDVDQDSWSEEEDTIADMNEDRFIPPILRDEPGDSSGWSDMDE